jgi:DUF1365 family protein
MRMAMTYRFRVVPPGDSTAVVVNGEDAEGRIIAASFAGRPRPMSDKALLDMLIRHGMLSLKIVVATH